MATTVAALANIAGNAVGALLPGLIVSDKSHYKNSQVTLLFLCHACFATLAFILVIFLFKNKPLVPPSPSADVKRQNVLRSIKILSKDCNFIIITIIFFCMNSGFTAIMEEVLHDYGYSDSSTYASFVGFILLIFGLIGSLLFALFAGKFKKFKLSLIIVSLMTTALIAFFTFYLVDLRDKWYTGILLCAYGFFNITGMPLALELSAQVTFPIGESISSGIIILASQVSSIGFTVVTSQLLDKPHSGTQLAYIINIINFGISALGTFFCFFIKDELKRSNMDKIEYNKLEEEEISRAQN